MNIISIDLPWNPSTKGRRALAITDLDGNTSIARASDDKELLELTSKHAEAETLVLLDVPIDGCDNLGNDRFRDIDRALSHYISIQPIPNDKYRGKRLAERLKTDKKGVKVYEIYPYAIYKFLAYLKLRQLLKYLKTSQFDALLDNRFKGFRPPKRAKTKPERQTNLKSLYSLLTDSSLGLRFLNPLRHPNTCHTFSELDRLCDEYDACFGAIGGLYWAKKSKYACIAGNSQSGEILLLADRWLQAKLRSKVQLRNK